MNGNISVSVVIPAHNSGATMSRALDSVLAQTRPADEIIAIDDASTDDTAAIARSYADRGVRLLALPERLGAAAARNAGIGAANGTWVAFLDADDEWLPPKLQRQMAAISANPETSFVFCASEEFSPEGHSRGDTFRGWPVITGREAWKALLAFNFVATPTVVACRALLLRVGGFEESLKVAEDQDMWIRLALTAPPTYVPETLVRVHIRPESLSSWRIADQYAYTLPMIEHHLATLDGRLTQSEARAIMGARLNKIGLTACAHGDLLRGLSMILRSMLLGYRPLRSLGIMAKAPLRAWLWRIRLFGKRG
jgi:glycosyltransferase involved in cell wall biosynthesis